MADKKKSLSELLNKISFLKIAGINRLILVDVYFSIVKFVCIKSKEPFYKIKSKGSFQKIEVIASEYHTIDDDYSLIKSHLKRFVEKNNLQDSYAVVGINDFKFNQVTLPSDVDDIDQWFGENSTKFLPEGRPVNEFHYSFEQYLEDENSKYFFVVVARADLISRIYDACNIDSIRLINISPFSLSFNSLVCAKEKNTLFLDLTNGKLIYTLVNYSGSVFSGEYYYKSGTLTQQSEITTISNSLDELYSSLSISVNDKSLEDPEIYICCKQEYIFQIKEIISKIFKPKAFNSGYETLDPFYTGSYLIYNKLVIEFDSQVNLLNKSRIADERFLLEKQVGMRTVLAGGLVLIILLLFGYFIENFITVQLNDEQETILNTNVKTAKVENLKKENERLSNNLSLLHSLKEKKTKYSPLLLDFTRMVTERSCLTSVSIKSADKELTDLEITGLADSHKEITEIISFLEKAPEFRDVSLAYASVKKGNEIKLAGLSSGNYMNFKIIAKYYADKE